MKIALVSPTGKNDKKAFSGTLHFMGCELARSHDLFDFSMTPITLFAKVANRLSRLLFGIEIDTAWHPFFSKISAVYIRFLIWIYKPEAIISVASSNYVCDLPRGVPLFHVSDATFRSISCIYPAYTRWPAWNIRVAEDAEARCLRRADMVLLSSDWAKDSAINDYNVPSENIVVTSYGSNLASDVLPFEIPRRDFDDACNILYIGMDWIRKGGETAYRTVSALRRMGVNANLFVVGNSPVEVDSASWCRCYGVLRKDSADDLALIIDLMSKAHFLILPTLADATPIVFNEAAAFGIPSISYNVGGTSSVVADGYTGRLLRPGSSAQDFASVINSIWQDRSVYESMSRGAFLHASDTANWAKWASTVSFIVSQQLYRK